MPVPEYERQRDFTDFSTNYPSTPHNGVWLDEEFDELKWVLDNTRDALEHVLRDDYQLKNLSVGLDQLKPEIVLGTPTDWVTATDYEIRDVVWNGSVLYVCNTDHTSGTFATDLAAVYWTDYLDYADPLGDAADYANAARDYRDAAAASASQAATAETAAEAAQAAAELAQAAAEAAQDAITLPLAVAEGGHGSTTAAGARINLGLVIGTNVQAYDAGLAWLDGLNFTNEATFKAGVNLEIGIDAQPYDVDTAKLDVAQSWAAAQTFLNTGLKVLDTNASHALSIVPGSNITADRAFTLVTGDADRTLDISAASVTISSFVATLTDDTTAAAFAATLGAPLLAASNTFTASLTQNYNYPAFYQRDSANGADLKIQALVTNDGSGKGALRLLDDAYSLGTNVLQWTRSTYTATILEVPSADFRIASAPSALSTNSAGFRGFGALQTLTTATTLTLLQNGQLVQQNSASSRVQTIPTNAAVAFPIANTAIPVHNIGAGTMVLTPDSGVTLYNEAGVSGAITLNQYHMGTLFKDGTNVWRYYGGHA